MKRCFAAPFPFHAFVDNNMNMSDNNLHPIVPRDALVKQGVSAVATLAGGVFVLIMAVGSQHGLFGIVLSAAALIIGVGALASKDAEAKKPGMVIAAAGVLALAVRFIPIAPIQAAAGTLLTIGAFGLLAAAVWKGIKFFKGLKTRQ